MDEVFWPTCCSKHPCARSPRSNYKPAGNVKTECHGVPNTRSALICPPAGNLRVRFILGILWRTFLLWSTNLFCTDVACGNVEPMAHFLRRLIALTAELERECPWQLSRRPFKDFSEACSHKKTATKGQSCWLSTAEAKSCFACVNYRSASLSSRCALNVPGEAAWIRSFAACNRSGMGGDTNVEVQAPSRRIIVRCRSRPIRLYAKFELASLHPRLPLLPKALTIYISSMTHEVP